MVAAELFGRVIAAIEAVMGPDAPIDGISVEQRDQLLRVFVTTPAPGRFIGRRGTTADALRARLVDDLGREVELSILETGAQTPPFDPPFDPPSGVREPRRPGPGSPPASVSLRPDRPEETDPPFTGRPLPPPSGGRPDGSPRRRGAA